MDYEKKLALAKEALDSGSYDKETIEYIFPELKESEDERMVKSMTRLVKAFYDCNFPTPEGFERKDLLAWLEKQGNKDEEILVLKDQIESLHAAIKAIKETHKIELEKQGEQNPALSEKETNGNESEIPNSAWSEEDEKRLRGVITMCDIWSTKTSFYPKESNDIENLKNWLKSLKDRVLPQPKQEWSEEDEQTFIKSVEALEDFGKFELADWLKEHKNQILRPQSQWKPSELQIEALAIAIRCGIQLGTWEETALKDLIEQLKKLKL